MVTITFLFFDGMTALDAIGPHEVLSRLPGAVIYRAAKQKGPIHCGCGLKLFADINLSAVKTTDVLIIPGGKNVGPVMKDEETSAWLHALHAQTKWTTSVCTGSLILGAAGLLKDVPATTHWAFYKHLSTFGAKPAKGRVIEAGKIITSAGVSAGIDMALLLAAKLSGEEAAQSIQLQIEYDPEPPFQAGSPLTAPSNIVKHLENHWPDL
ncbi:MAG: DJ-1/PfpI family protein [Parachlamydia sp.]|jgi:transcriptional regulator GlxA family with amidase domain|nr:DJ-1/PfpI family protein [Parachlamydia sp.]